MRVLETLPKPSVVWRNGMIVRTSALYVMMWVLSVQTSMMSYFFFAILIIEAGCFWLYRLARQNGSRQWLFLLTYLSVGDIVWVAGALATAIASGRVPAWGFISILAIWLASICVNLIASGHSRMRQQIIRDDIATKAGCLETGRRYSPIDSIMSGWLAMILIAIGLLGIILAYIVDQKGWFLVMLSVSFLGLACGFSPRYTSVNRRGVSAPTGILNN